jgi:hypothetical protein
MTLKGAYEKKLIVYMVLIAFWFSPGAFAKGRQPCSGKKGGVSHCQGGKLFVTTAVSANQRRDVDCCLNNLSTAP